jgi:hypothetical protein
MMPGFSSIMAMSCTPIHAKYGIHRRRLSWPQPAPGSSAHRRTAPRFSASIANEISVNMQVGEE